jgi:hypothetical protein
MIVLDANILIRAVLGRRVRQLIETYAHQGVRFYAPDIAFEDAEKYLPCLRSVVSPIPMCPRHLNIYVGSSSQLIKNYTTRLRTKLDSACEIAMRPIGPYWQQLWDWCAQYGPKIRTFSEQVSVHGQQIASKFFSEHK